MTSTEKYLFCLGIIGCAINLFMLLAQVGMMVMTAIDLIAH